MIATIEDFMWLKLHMVQPTASSSAVTSSRLSPTSSSNLLSPSYTIAALQVTVVHLLALTSNILGPFSQTGAMPCKLHPLFSMQPCSSETLRQACHGWRASMTRFLLHLGAIKIPFHCSAQKMSVGFPCWAPASMFVTQIFK